MKHDTIPQFLKGIELHENLVKGIFLFKGLIRLERENGEIIKLNPATGDTDFIDANLVD